MIKKGDMVKSYHGYIGIVQTEFKNWDDLKSKNDFLTTGNDNKDLWLMEFGWMVILNSARWQHE